LPTEQALTEQTRKFKQITIEGYSSR
jgi:hypothetical protein